MAKHPPIPQDCRTCPSLWTHGQKNGRNDRWCCHFGAPAPKMIGHCKTTGYFGSPAHEKRKGDFPRPASVKPKDRVSL